jgi:hypothetical protein
VTEDDDLQIGLSHRALARSEQAEETAQQKVEERSDHGDGLSQMTIQPPHTSMIEFLDPARCRVKVIRVFDPYTRFVTRSAPASCGAISHSSLAEVWSRGEGHDRTPAA